MLSVTDLFVSLGHSSHRLDIVSGVSAGAVSVVVAAVVVVVVEAGAVLPGVPVGSDEPPQAAPRSAREPIAPRVSRARTSAAADFSISRFPFRTMVVNV